LRRLHAREIRGLEGRESGEMNLMMDPEAQTSRRALEIDALTRRIEGLDWQRLEGMLTETGHAILPKLLEESECVQLAELYEDGSRFRSRIVMERHAFGRGEYKYFSYPLPVTVTRLRTMLYTRLAPVANRWHQAMRLDERFPPDHRDFLDICHRDGQTRPTPLMLRYAERDYCCLHQDLYGDHVFPFQAIFLLSKPGEDFEGGELLLTETDPKGPGRAEVVPLQQGDAVVLAVNSKPVRSSRGYYRASLRHGVSEIRRGHRSTLGIIFHEAS
jgi:hypothetical protein